MDLVPLRMQSASVDFYGCMFVVNVSCADTKALCALNLDVERVVQQYGRFLSVKNGQLNIIFFNRNVSHRMNCKGRGKVMEAVLFFKSLHFFRKYSHIL